MIGSLSVTIQLVFDTAAVSSFELEEHLASLPAALAASVSDDDIGTEQHSAEGSLHPPVGLFLEVEAAVAG